MSSELSAGAEVYVPLKHSTPRKSAPSSTPKTPTPKECQSTGTTPQSSRYSRKTIRLSNTVGDSPRPILGNKVPFPRPILGRKEFAPCITTKEKIGSNEFKCSTRQNHVKMSNAKNTPQKNKGCGL